MQTLPLFDNAMLPELDTSPRRRGSPPPILVAIGGAPSDRIGGRPLLLSSGYVIPSQKTTEHHRSLCQQHPQAKSIGNKRGRSRPAFNLPRRGSRNK